MVIDIEQIKKHNLSIIDYVHLKFFYHSKNGTETEYVENFGYVDSADLSGYGMTGWIKIIQNDDGSVDFELRDKLRNLFEGKKDLFLTFLSNFPIKTPSGRYLGTKDENTIKGKKLRKKWNSLFKNNSLAAEKAIKVLDAEMEWRRKTGKFEFMHNAETWLNQGDFENYEYLLSDRKEIKTKIRSDYE